MHFCSHVLYIFVRISLHYWMAVYVCLGVWVRTGQALCLPSLWAGCVGSLGAGGGFSGGVTAVCRTRTEPKGLPLPELFSRAPELFWHAWVQKKKCLMSKKVITYFERKLYCSRFSRAPLPRENFTQGPRAICYATELFKQPNEIHWEIFSRYHIEFD